MSDSSENLEDSEPSAMAAPITPELDEINKLRDEILASSPDVVIANHCFGLFELAAIYLSDSPPRLRDATLAIDALSGITEATKGRLGTRENEIREGLSQLRLAFIQVSTLNNDSNKNSGDSV